MTETLTAQTTQMLASVEHLHELYLAAQRAYNAATAVRRLTNEEAACVAEDLAFLAMSKASALFVAAANSKADLLLVVR